MTKVKDVICACPECENRLLDDHGELIDGSGAFCGPCKRAGCTATKATVRFCGPCKRALEPRCLEIAGGDVYLRHAEGGRAVQVLRHHEDEEPWFEISGELFSRIEGVANEIRGYDEDEKLRELVCLVERAQLEGQRQGTC